MNITEAKDMVDSNPQRRLDELERYVNELILSELPHVNKLEVEFLWHTTRTVSEPTLEDLANYELGFRPNCEEWGLIWRRFSSQGWKVELKDDKEEKPKWLRWFYSYNEWIVFSSGV